MNKIAFILTGIILLIMAVLSFGVIHYHGVAVTALADNKTLSDDLKSQGIIIANQSLTFQHYNAVAQAADQANTNSTAKSQEVDIVYRTILKDNPTCNLYIPADIANGLYDYANRLRASAMYADSSSALKTAVSATTSNRLTYCQAVLWINPLLTIIDQTINNLKAIAAIEEARQK